MSRRCAIYARYSSDLQRASSIEDQVRICREHAGQKGWAIIEEFVVADRAISGAALAGRDGLQALIAASRRKPRPFDCVLVEDTSRLGRNVSDTIRTTDILEFNRVAVVSVSQGIDSSQPGSRQMLALNSVMDQQYLEGLSDKVHRGQEGRVIEGFNPGGRIFGYHNVPVEDPTRKAKYGRPAVLGVRLEINEGQAVTIRRIYDLYASGLGLAGIAKLLNEEGVQSPQPQRHRIFRAWCPASIRTILTNERYRGVFVWNRTRKVRNPETGRKTSRKRSADEIQRRENPEWRIVSEEQWEAVRRQFARANQAGIQRLGGQLRTERSRSYLFSGILRCGVCHARLVIISGGGNRGYVKYGCPSHRYRGICKNKLYIRRDRLEEQLIHALELRLLEKHNLDYLVKRVHEEVQDRIRRIEKASGLTSPEALRGKVQELAQQADLLTSAIAQGGDMPALLSGLRKIEEERERLTVQLKAVHRPAKISITEAQVREQVTKSLLQLRDLMIGEGAPAAKAALQRHIPELVLTPTERDGRNIYQVTGQVNLGEDTNCVMQVVARDGLEPPPPAYSGPRADPPKWFRINGSC